jgi:hypothetical protein
MPTVTSRGMDEVAFSEALERLAGARERRPSAAELEATLERTRRQVECLAAAARVLQCGLPGQIEEGIKEHFRPSARHLAELRGLMGQMIRRFEHLENDMLAERNARVEDLSLVVELISSGWRNANERLARIEAAVAPEAGARVYHLPEPEKQAG